MVNLDRIVPITKIDRISAFGEILAVANVSFTVIAPTNVEGDFEVTGTGAAGNKLANQPLKSVDFKSGVTGGTVYFVPAYNFGSVKVAGSAATIDTDGLGLDDIVCDGVTMYKAVLATGEVTLTAVTPSLPTT